jgi:hypothetical protein
MPMCGLLKGCGVMFVRALRVGLSSLRDRAAARLAGSRFNPSRVPEMLYREPFAVTGFVAFMTVYIHYRAAHLWTLPIVLAGFWLAYVGDELWQDRLDGK